MKMLTSETLLATSSCATLLMLCCAIVHCIDLWAMCGDEMREASSKSSTLFRSGWFFYTNAALCLGCVFILFWLG